MKRRISVVIAVLVCILSLFTACLSGCKKSVGASYKKGSFNVIDFYYNDYSKSQYVNYEMLFKVKEEAEYDVEMTVCGREGKSRLWETTVFFHFSSEVNDECHYTGYFFATVDEGASEFTVKKITITKVNDGNEGSDSEGEAPYYAITIALGIFAALLLGGLIALFVLDKKGILNGKK